MNGFVDIEDYLWSTQQWDHTPQAPYPRSEWIGENVFADEWKRLMEKRDRYHEAPNSQLAGMLTHLPRWPRPYDAKICASVVCWLGTNCGMSVIDESRRITRAGMRDGMLMAWAKENVRYKWLNNGVRTIESILAKPEHYGPRWGGHGLIRRPRLSRDTYEVVDHLMSWLGSDAGERFIKHCEGLVKEHRRLAEIARLDTHAKRMEAMGMKVAK